MIAFYCLTAAGFVLLMQDKCNREIVDIKKPSLREIERRLDAESEALDQEIERLLAEHRKLCQG